MKKAIVLFFHFLFISFFSEAQTSTSLKDGHTIVTYTDKQGKPQWHYAAGCERMAVMQMEASIFCKMCSDKRKKETAQKELKKQQETKQWEEKRKQRDILVSSGDEKLARGDFDGAVEDYKKARETYIGSGVDFHWKITNALQLKDKADNAKSSESLSPLTLSPKTDYRGSSSNQPSTTTNSSTNKPSQSPSYSSPTKANNNAPPNSTIYQGVGKYESSGPGIIYPVGPGTKRADGNYDVVDKYGKTHIIDAKTNEKLEIKQRDAEAKQQMASQQQKIQEQFKQQEAARQKQVEINRQREAQINALADQAANTVYQIGTGIANLINEGKARKERERQRQLEIKQREEALKLKLEQEKQFRIGVRTNIFENYKDSSFPISTTKMPYNKLYYFIYAYDGTMIDKEGLIVYVSEKPFEIARYSDGTWPYKKSVADKIANITPHNEIITGYYPSENEALGALEFFKNSLSKSSVIFQEIKYQNAKQASATQNSMNNFWKKTTDTVSADSTKTNTKKDKYWK